MKFRLPNLPHQQEEFDEFRFAKARALLWQMRTGKSKACIDLACDLYERGEIDRVLILAPNNVHIGWIREQIPRHAWLEVPWRARYWSSKENARDKEWLSKLDQEVIRPKDFEGLIFYAVNSETLRYPKPKKSMELFIASAKKGVLFIADESQDFKKPGSIRGRLARKIASACEYKRILTGSGFDNSPLNAWGQFEILQPGALGFKTYGAFEAEYAIKTVQRMGNRQFMAVTGYRGLDDLRQRIARWSSVVTREEVKGLPELNYSHEYFELSEPQQKAYDLVKAKMLTVGTDIKSPIMLSKAFEGGVQKLKMLQITSGFFVDEHGEETWFKENPRVEVLKRLVRDLQERGQKFIIWCRFINDILTVSKALGELNIDHVQFYGGVNAEQREVNKRKFMQDPNCLGFVGNPKAGGRGLDLSAASSIIWYSRDYDLEFKRQADERATHVGGKAVDIIEIVAADTVDVAIMKALEEKLTISEMIDRTGLQAFLEGQMQAFEDSIRL